MTKDPCAGLDVYRVGGAVRDAHLGWPVKDTDWVVVGATPEDMRKRGFRPVGRDFPVFLHPQTQEEYALARTERKSGHGYTGFVVHASPDVTLEEDLVRRDLTINAMAESMDGTLVDPFGGMVDLEARILRHVSPAFVEDPLRVLRTARFLARYAGLGFSVAASTMALMSKLAESGELTHLVAERVWTETERALSEPFPEQYFRTLDSCGALKVLMPELYEHEGLEPRLKRMQVLPEALKDVASWRWGRLLETLSESQRADLGQRLRMPRVYRELMEQLAYTRQLANAGADTAQSIMTWLESIDAWRRSERVGPLLSVLALDHPELAASVGVAWQAASSLAPRDLVKEGYSGSELGHELARRRLAAISRSL
uniref:polynucleotide adenylyltransferase n=1 Tax=Halomonas sp. TaxID=1486246 RepID=UPI00261C79D7|nr:polynucleotide adenylyltransferase [Halomonas sp.]